jgi:hypothetical protein
MQETSVFATHSLDRTLAAPQTTLLYLVLLREADGQSHGLDLFLGPASHSHHEPP